MYGTATAPATTIATSPTPAGDLSETSLGTREILARVAASEPREDDRFMRALVVAVAVGATAVALAVTTAGGADDTATSPGTVAVRESVVLQEQAKRCSRAEVGQVVSKFAAAFNRGDGRTLARVVAREPRFQWYSTDAPGKRLGPAAGNRKTLGAYFARRHAAGERLRLVRVKVNGNTDGGGGPYGNFEFDAMRSAHDLASTPYNGKGAVYCFRDRADMIFVWSMAAATR
jgi:hypothetical protein